MTISIKHKFVNPKWDTADTTVTRASNWNDEHELTLAQNRVLGRVSAANGPVEELTGAQVRALSDTAQSGVLPGVNTRTASYTLVASDRGKVIEMNVSSPATVTVPSETGVSGVNFPIGTEIYVVQLGTGTATLLPGGGVTLQSTTGGLATTSQYSSIMLYKRGANNWLVMDAPYATASASAAASSASAAATSAALAGSRADDIAALAGYRDFSDVTLLLANTTLTYTAALTTTVVPGEIIRTRSERFSYKVALAAATDHHVATAGGVKLYVVPDENGLNVKAFGAVGDGVANDNAEVQAALDAATAIGAPVFVPKGTFFCPNGLSITYTTLLYDKPVIVGQGASISRFTTNANNVFLAVTASYNTSGQQRNMFRGFSITNNNANNGIGISITEANYMGFEDVAINSFFKGVVAKDVICASFYKCMFVANSVGVEASRTGFSHGNAWAFYGCTINGNTLRGLHFEKAATVSLDACTLESNGTMATADTAAIYVNGNPAEGAVGVTARSCYFEGTRGDADVLIDCNDGDSAMHSFVGCTFNRISATNYVTNNIQIKKSGAGFVGVDVRGCGFRHFNNYTPSAARRCVAFSGVINGINYNVDLVGAYFSSSTDKPDLGGAATSIRGYSGAWARITGASGALFAGHNVASVSRTATGTYTITFARAMSLTGHVVNITPVGTTGFGSLDAESSSAITVKTYTTAGVLTDWPALSVSVFSE